MKYGNWERAIFKSVCWGFLALVAYAALAQAFEGDLYESHENILLLTIAAVVYFGLSIVGWVLLGIPTHFALCYWLKPKYQYYSLVCAAISVALIITKGFNSSLIFVVAIFFQATLFRYYVFQPKT